MSAVERETEHEVCSNTYTVWVNSCIDGSCLGRFSKFGIDVHCDVATQLRTGMQCLDCTHNTPTITDWERFVYGMLIAHGVEVSEEHRPEWLVE